MVFVLFNIYYYYFFFVLYVIKEKYTTVNNDQHNVIKLKIILITSCTNYGVVLTSIEL